ncbi:hypothetical protein BK127_23370 [Paenibacillus sp. FSL H7-0331]|nr:hypothetical protein BK127_23370 [Paenibacillus sp. FSL H7-0331]
MLWCANCSYAHDAELWKVKGYKYGSCPKCGQSEYRYANNWIVLADLNGWLLPINGNKYEVRQLNLDFNE